MTALSHAATLTPANAALLAMAENLWQVKKDLNASDVHGVHSLSVSGPGTAYDAVSDALRLVILPLVNGDEEDADEVMFHLVDNYESVAWNLDVVAKERARLDAEEAHSNAVRAKFDAMLAEVATEAENNRAWALRVMDTLGPVVGPIAGTLPSNCDACGNSTDGPIPADECPTNFHAHV